MRLVFLKLLIILSCISCSNKYNAYKSQYNFKSPDSKPDYNNLSYWAAHPWKKDPSDSVPAPLKNELRDSTVDVFFLHPTTYTKNKRSPNAMIDDPYLNAKTDYTSILYQASAFNQLARVFAPRYRQGHIKMFFEKDEKTRNKIFDLAYEDVRSSFEHYLKYWNQGRPVIIAAHSQGSMLGERLLKDFFDDPGSLLKNKLVAAYMIGWPVPKNYFSYLKMCEDSLQTGCICSWRTLRRNFVPFYLKNENGNSFVTNPLTWITGPEYASRKLNKGSVLRNFNKIYYQTTDAMIKNGLLYVNHPKFPGSFLYFTRNYHIGDINLYYVNVRQNVAKRIGMFWKK